MAFTARSTGYLAAQDTPAPEVSARFAAVGGTLRACGRLPFWQLRAGLCLGPSAFALRGRASGAIREASSVAPWYAASGSATLGWPRAARVRVELEGGLNVSLNRPRFVIQGLSQVHRVPSVVPELALLLALEL